MTSTRFLALVLLLALPIGSLRAAENVEPVKELDKFKDVLFDTKKKGKLRRGLEIDRTISVPAPQLEQPDCQPELSISYQQMNDRVRVDTTVVNRQCGASSGEYTIRVRSRAETGEIHTRDFPERWSRTDAEDFQTTAFYSMEGDLNLLWARVMASRTDLCSCDVPVTDMGEAVSDADSGQDSPE